MKILAIAACDPNGVMGKNQKLPWHDKEELAHFQTTIQNAPLMMGYKTYLSLPSKYFNQRTCIIFTREHRPKKTDPHLIFVSSIEEFLSLDLKLNQAFVIGGALIYQLFLKENLIEELILTKMKSVYDGDTFFPLSSISHWENHLIKENYNFSVYRYINPLASPYAYPNL
jgi:dihydrofolate reductase